MRRNDVDLDATKESDSQSTQPKDQDRAEVNGPTTRRMRRQPLHLQELLQALEVLEIAVMSATKCLNHPRQPPM